MNSIANLKHAKKISNSSRDTARFFKRETVIEVRPNQRNEKIFSEGGHRKINPKVIVHIIYKIITREGVYENTMCG